MRNADGDRAESMTGRAEGEPTRWDALPPLATGMARRRLLRGAASVTAAALVGGMPVRAASSPYPAAGTLGLRRLDSLWLWRNACESDQWPHVALNRSTILCAWGDGFGWQVGRTELKAFLGFSSLSGTPEHPVGHDTWSDASTMPVRRLRLKPCALLKVGRACFLYAAGDRDGRDGTMLLRGPADGSGLKLVASSVLRRSTHGLQVVGAVHHAGGKGDIILLLGEDGNTKILYDRPRNSRIWAARADAGNLGNVAAWEWFSGLDGSGGPVWQRAAVNGARFDAGSGPAVQPVFEDPAGCGKHVMISWCPSLNGYVLAKTQEKTGLGLFLGETPFGPWQALYYGPFVPASADGLAHIFTAQVVGMWSQGASLALMWGGHPGFSTNCSAPNQATNYDAVYLTRFAVERA